MLFTQKKDILIRKFNPPTQLNYAEASMYNNK